jgi:hypothetical protein
VGCADKKLINIRGIVMPAGWNENGNVTALSISTFNEEEYLIEKNQQEKQLYSFIRKEVEVDGIIKGFNGKKKIEIKHYRIR